MHPIIEICGLHLPLYGIIGIISVMILVLSGWFVLHKSDLSTFDGMVLGAYGMLGAYIGAKLLFIIQDGSQVSLKDTDEWLQLMRNGGSAYGGILVGILFGIFGARIHKIDYKGYVNKTAYLLPLCHAIWKFGCHCAGCCYGIPYSGIGNIVFLEGASAPVGVKLFPVQMLEVVFLFIMAIYMCVKKKCSLSWYLLIYSCGRFCIEFLRNEERKNVIGIFSDVQYLCIAVVIFILIEKYAKGKTYEKQF